MFLLRIKLDNANENGMDWKCLTLMIDIFRSDTEPLDYL